MRRPAPRPCLLASLLLAWLPLGAPAADPGDASVRPSADVGRRVDVAGLVGRLARAPMERSDPRAGIEIALPLPNGRTERFRAMVSPILGPGLTRLLPDVRTYRAVGLDDPQAVARMDVTARGFRAIVATREGTAFIEPVEPGRTDVGMSHWDRGLEGPGSFECKTADRAMPAPTAVSRSSSTPVQLRTYRLVLVGTGEYTQYLGGVANATAEMITSINRLNMIYERDLAVRFVAAGLLPFPDPATDPFPGTFGDLELNQTVVDSNFDPSSYDLAQTLDQRGTTIAGLSYAPAVCTESKAGSWVEAGNVTANDLMIRVMAHELGHVLGAFHTGGCGPILAGAHEPGSGSTIMGRAIRCGVNDVLPAFLYFHAASIDAITQTLDGLPECGTSASTGSTAPAADAGADYTIPLGTPFALQGSGSDPDAPGLLTYSWEQWDQAVSANDTLTGPLDRYRPPTAVPVRYVPIVATVLADTIDKWEKLPRSNRLVHFRLVARDNHPGAGGHGWDDMTITATGAPFQVTSPDGGETIPTGPYVVTWNVGGGSVASHVNILLSTDGGASWTPLAANVPNDGSEDVALYSPVTTSTCRVKVEAVGNIFYDVSHADFTILGGVTSTLLTLFDANATPEGIVIRWRFSAPFERVVVERSDTGGASWSVATGELREEPEATRFLDPAVTPGHVYEYRLLATRDGTTSTFGPVRAQALETGYTLAITRVTPSPASRTFRVEYALPRAGHVRLTMLDVLGREVATLVDGVEEAGPHVATWKASAPGQPAGLYFLRLQSGNAAAVRRTIMLD